MEILKKKQSILDGKNLYIVGGVLSVAAFVFILYKIIATNAPPQSYEEIRPMMDEAMAFDRQASEVSGAFQGTDAQLSQAQQDYLAYEPYRNASEVQAHVIAAVNETEDFVEARGGITTVEDLEALRIPVKNNTDAKALDSVLNSHGLKK